MVSTSAFIQALQGKFAAARQAQAQGAGSALPGILGSTNGESGNALNSPGVSGGGVPGTATTGASVGNALAGGGIVGGDPIARQVFGITGGFANNREPGERGDLGADVTGGDVSTLLSVLGGPTAALSILGSLVASNELGLPPTTSINSLIESSGGFNDLFNESSSLGREIGGNVGGPSVTGSIPGGGSVGSIRTGRSREEIDRGSGRSPSRGTVSNAGR